MSAYKFHNPEGIYFVTFTVVEWVDIFTRDVYRRIVLDSLKYCIKEKGLVVYSWVVMSNHLHLIIAKRNQSDDLSSIVRDFKKFTSSQIIKEIGLNPNESRKNWMLWLFQSAGKRNRNNKDYQFWKQDSHAKELISNDFMQQKLDYIHNNPVAAGIVDEAIDFRYSSARDYSGMKGLLEIEFIE